MNDGLRGRQRDPLWMKMFLGVHILAGTSSFLMAPVALVTAKGGSSITAGDGVPVVDGRRRSDGAADGAVPASVSGSGSCVQLLSGVFGISCTGLKDLSRGEVLEPIDWFAAVLCLTASACLAGFAVSTGACTGTRWGLTIVFGYIGMRWQSGRCGRFLWKPTEKMFWWYTHLGTLRF